MRRAYDDPSWWRALRLEDFLVLTSVVALPWMFGGVEMWAFRSAAALLAAGMAAWLWRGNVGEAGRRWLLPAWLLLALAVVQVLPMPAGIVRLASPRSAALHDGAFPASASDRTPAGWIAYVESEALSRVPEGRAVPLRDAASPAPEPTSRDPQPPGRWPTISLHPGATVEMLFWYLALLAAFLVISERVEQREVAVAYRLTMFGLFGALAVIGLLDAVAGNGKLLWIREPLSGGRHLGPYVNATHFAGAMELAAPWLLGHGWMALRREGTAAFRRGGSAPATLACGALCLAAGLVAASKMAGALLAVAVVALAWLGLRSRRSRVLLVAGVALLTVPAAIVLQATTLGRRFRDFLAATGGDIGGYERIVAWKAGLDMLADFPLFGCGFGAFPQVFPAYLPAGEAGSWLRVHNDWLEVALEGGAVAFVLVAWLAIAWVRRAARAAGRRSGAGTSRDLGRLGLWLGLASLSIHAVVDFNHQIPANALLFVTVAAIALAPDLLAPRKDGR